MARKKAAPPTDPAYKNVEGVVCLPPAQLWRYRALTAEIKVQELEGALAKARFDALVERTPALVAQRQRAVAAGEAQARALAEYQVFQAELARATGLDLSACGIDDETGVMRVLE